jgi:hypothetical protein
MVEKIGTSVDMKRRNSKMRKIKVVSKIKKKGYPTAEKDYATSHEKADKVEKKTYPKGYKKMQKVDDKIPKGELAGTHSKKGKIEISKKVPKKLRKEVATHEYVEWKEDQKLCAKCKKPKRGHHG